MKSFLTCNLTFLCASQLAQCLPGPGPPVALSGGSSGLLSSASGSAGSAPTNQKSVTPPYPTTAASSESQSTLSAGSGLQGRGPINPVSPVTASSLPAGGTVVVGTVSSNLVSETFVPTIYSQYVSLLTTTTSTSLNAQSTPVLIVIGPGGIDWAP